MSLESNKTLGGVGAILLAIPFLNLIGIILVLIAMKGMADYYKDENIFKNALYGFIFGVIGVIAMIAVIIMLVIGTVAISPYALPFAGISLFLIAFIVLYVFSLIGAVFYRKSLDALSYRSGEHMFNTAGLILLIGAAIPVVGEVLKFVAWILAAVGFFGIKEPAPLTVAATTVVPKVEQKRFCQNCGAEVQSGAAFCQKCGSKID